MSKYFDGYASFDYKEMSKEKLITELKEKVRYIGELKRNNNKEIAKVQSIKDKQISDLETKLAESEERCILLEGLRKSEEEKKDIAMKRVYELKQQLAEKEKEIESLKFKLDIRAISLQNINNERIQANQDKIEFAIERLEKVKHYAKHIQGGLIDYIDNQINELKEKK